MADRIKLPADVEIEDKVAFGLTARQLLILAATSLAGYMIFDAVRSMMPVVVAAALTTPPVGCGALLALGRRDGLPADRLAILGLRHLLHPRRQVLAPEGIPTPTAEGRVGALRLPVSRVLRSGLVELETGGFRMMLAAGAASFALRSEEEQASMVEAFGRFLNSLSDPVQISVRAEPVDLAPRAHTIDTAASGMPHPALAQAARDHARFLRDLGGGSLRRRQILLVLTTPGTDREAARAVLARKASEARELLAAAGVTLEPLDGERSATTLARVLTTPAPPTGSHLEGKVTAC